MQSAAPAAHGFFEELLRSGGPLRTPTEAAFSSQREQLPPAQRAAFETPAGVGTMGSVGDAAAIIREVFGSSLAARPGREAATEALNDRRQPSRVQTGAGIMTAAECAILCHHCDEAMADSQRGGTRDNVDGLPDFQVNLTGRQIEDLLRNESPPLGGGGPAAGFTGRFEELLVSCAAAAVAGEGESGSLSLTVERGTRLAAHSLESVPKDWGRVGIFVRRYSASTRPWMPFHCDGNAFTANVALSGASEHEGGTLLCLVDGIVRAYERQLGSATVHGGAVCHAVTPVTAGTRYALLIFFHEIETSDHAESAKATAEQQWEQQQQAASQQHHTGIQELDLMNSRP